MENITLEYLKKQYGDVDMLLCGRHKLGEDRVSTDNIDIFIITSFWDDRFDPKTATTKHLKLKNILESVGEHDISIDHEIKTIVVKFGNRFK